MTNEKERLNMNKIIMMTIGFVMLLGSARAELLENGKFSKKAAHWEMAAPSDYGLPPEVKIQNGEFQLENLHTAVPGYLTLNQAVDIRKDIKYKLTFEAKGEGSGHYLITFQDPGKLAHVSKLFTPAASWETNTVEFTGQFDTDHKWVREWLKATRQNRLEGGRTVGSTFQNVPVPKTDGPSRTWFTVAVGQLAGSFAIRNVSVVEVP